MSARSAHPAPRSSIPGRRLCVLLGASLVALTACDEAVPSPVAPEQTRLVEIGLDGNRTGWDLPLMSLGQLNRSVPGRPCASGAHRDFDFWLGDWNVVEPNTGRPFGTNVVTSELDGCAVREEYTAGNGIRGLSLNTYDRETTTWHQAWVSQIPQSFITRLRTSGGVQDGVMILEGQRDATFNGIPFTISDEWSWTPTVEGHVIQTGFALAGPPFNQVLTNFTARYERAAIQRAPNIDTPFCNSGFPGAPTRGADFLIGDWEVRGDDGPAVATSTIETDLSRCLFVERFDSHAGVRAVTYTYWDRWSDQWFWIWVDNRGERLQLSGELDGTSLVLSGREHRAGEHLHVRLTIAGGADMLRQMWEVSHDGGSSWERGAELRYERR